MSYHFVLADGTAIRERRQVEGVVKPLFGEWEEMDFRIAAYDPKGMPPAWVRGSVMYQIFPDRFAIGDPNNLHKKSGLVYGRKPIYKAWGDTPEHPPKSRDFFGGDLCGIMDKLDYLHGLGITLIYMTPIFESPTNHRYDAVDYFKVDARLGSENDLEKLVDEAKKRGMKVMLDGVFNHCSSDSVYFKQACTDKTSPWYRRFEFSAWPEYDGWVGVKTMPEFVECPETEDFFFGPNGVARYWLKIGIAGWRTDVTPWITHGFWQRFRSEMKSISNDVYLVSEDWSDCTPRFVGDSFDATMNYRFAYTVVGFANGKLTSSELDDRLETLRRDTPEPVFHAQMNLLTSHDTPRLLNLCEFDRSRVMLAAALQLGYPGAPMIYYGDEAGCTQVHPECESGRVSFPWDSPDEELQAFYRTAIHARRNSSALSLGSVETMWIDDASNTYGFARAYEDECVFVLLNVSDSAAEVEVACEDGAWHDLLGRLPNAQASNGKLRVTLPPKMAGWLMTARR